MMLGLKNRVAGLDNSAPKRIQWFNSLERFGLRAQLLHAVIGAAILFMLVLGLAFPYIPDRIKGPAFTLHKGLGLWILLAVIIWFIHWLRQPTPVALPSQTKPQFRLAKLVHKILLVLCLFMPLSGWIMVSAWSGKPVAVWPGVSLPPIALKDVAFAQAMVGVHILLAWTIGGLIALHVLGALYHHIYRRDPILKRMIPRFRPPAGYYRYQFERGVNKARKLR